MIPGEIITQAGEIELNPLLTQQGIEVAIVTNDLLTTEDADRLKSGGILPSDR